LGVGHNLAVDGVDTGEVLVLTLAGFESSILGVIGGVVGTPNTVQPVLAVFRVIGFGRITSLQTKGITTHEAKIADVVR
jgi:hypothetical protein